MDNKTNFLYVLVKKKLKDVLHVLVFGEYEENPLIFVGQNVEEIPCGIQIIKKSSKPKHNKEDPFNFLTKTKENHLFFLGGFFVHTPP